MPLKYIFWLGFIGGFVFTEIAILWVYGDSWWLGRVIRWWKQQ